MPWRRRWAARFCPRSRIFFDRRQFRDPAAAGPLARNTGWRCSGRPAPRPTLRFGSAWLSTSTSSRWSHSGRGNGSAPRGPPPPGAEPPAAWSVGPIEGCAVVGIDLRATTCRPARATPSAAPAARELARIVNHHAVERQFLAEVHLPPGVGFLCRMEGESPILDAVISFGLG